MRAGASDDFPKSASERALRLSEVELTASERHAFAQWLAGGNDRLREVKQALAVLRISRALRDSDTAHALLDRSLRALEDGAYPARFPRRRAIAAGGAALAAGGLFAAILQSRGTSGAVLGDSAKVATAVGSIEHFNLSDRSSLTVGASSAVQVAFTNARREVSLHKGKAFFDVSHNAGRPFTVKAGSRQIVVTGTQFNVSYNHAKDQMEVAVVEGSVNVGASNGANRRLTAGAVTLFPSRSSGISRRLTPGQASAWRSGILHFDDTELDDILFDVNGYLPKPLTLASAGLSNLTLTAQLSAGDTQAALFILREVLGIGARELSDRWELFKAAD